MCRCGGKRSDPGNTPTVDRPQCKFTSYQLFKMCDIGPTQLSTTSEEKLSRVLDTGRQYSYIPHLSLQLQIRCAAFSAVKRLTGVVNRFATNKILCFARSNRAVSSCFRYQLHQLLIEMGLLQNVIADEVHTHTHTHTHTPTPTPTHSLVKYFWNSG